MSPADIRKARTAALTAEEIDAMLDELANVVEAAQERASKFWGFNYNAKDVRLMQALARVEALKP